MARIWKAENQREDYTERAQQGVPLKFSAEYQSMHVGKETIQENQQVVHFPELTQGQE